MECMMEKVDEMCSKGESLHEVVTMFLVRRRSFVWRSGGGEALVGLAESLS
jgi:hypothetical protein